MSGQAAYGRVRTAAGVVSSGKGSKSERWVSAPMSRVNCLHEGLVQPTKSAHNLRVLSSKEAALCKDTCNYGCQP